MTFARVLESAGLTKVELASLYAVSRQTIHTWASSGGPRAGSHTARMAETVTRALLSAVDRRILPLGAMSVEARRARIASMRTTLQALHPAPVK